MIFIVVRHARTDTDAQLCSVCVESIREFYPTDRILVVDDHSPEPARFEDIPNVTVVPSEFEAGRGELLGWYYFWKTTSTSDPNEVGCMLHDSMCLTGPLPDTTRPARLWSFRGTHLLGNHGEAELLSKLNPGHVAHMFQTASEWQGCFGLCAVLPWSVVDVLERNGIFRLLEHVRTRTDRMAMERIFGWMLYVSRATNASLFGDIHMFPRAFHEVPNPMEVMRAHRILRLFPVAKVWRGR